MREVRVVAGAYSVEVISRLLDGLRVTISELEDVSIACRSFETYEEHEAYLLGIIDMESEYRVLSDLDYATLQRRLNGTKKQRIK